MRSNKFLVMAMVSLLAMLLPLVAGCAGVKSEEVKGLLQAMDGKDVVVTLDDGSMIRVRVGDDQAAAKAKALVGEEVKIRVRAEDRQMIEVERLGEDAKFTGVIESMGAGVFIIGGKSFMVNANTELDGGLMPGVQARVEFVKLADGTLLATEIETDKQAEQFNATVQSISAGSIVIGGKTFMVNAATRLEKGLVAGMQAKVEFVVLPDGTLLATEIELENANDRQRGRMEGKAEDSILVSGKSFRVNAATRIDRSSAIGKEVEVKFIRLSDGTLLAREIEIEIEPGRQRSRMAEIEIEIGDRQRGRGPGGPSDDGRQGRGRGADDGPGDDRGRGGSGSGGSGGGGDDPPGDDNGGGGGGGGGGGSGKG